MEGKRVKQFIILFLVVPIMWGINGVAFAGGMDAAMQECLMKAMEKADDIDNSRSVEGNL